jgi:uncharacterized protein
MNLPYQPDQEAAQINRVEALVVGFIIASIIEAEAATALVAPLIGVILHGAIVLTIINIYLLIPFLPHRKAFLTLLLLPILRLMSLTIPISALPPLYWYAAIGIPLLFSTTVVINMVHPPVAPLLFRFPKAFGQIAFGLVGIPLSVAAYRLIPVTPFFNPANWIEVLIGVISLTIFSAFAEELIFRYLIQSTLEEVFGKLGVWLGAILYASLFATTLSLPAICFWGIVGLLFGFWVKRTHSIWGAVFAHSLILVGGVVVYPLVLH